MKISVSVSVHVGKCWKITKKHLVLIHNDKTMGRLPCEYDDLALPVINKWRRTEEFIIKNNQFDKRFYDEELKKLIQGIKNKYNTKK